MLFGPMYSFRLTGWVVTAIVGKFSIIKADATIRKIVAAARVFLLINFSPKVWVVFWVNVFLLGCLGGNWHFLVCSSYSTNSLIKYYVSLNTTANVYNTKTKPPPTSKKPKPQQTIFKPTQHHIPQTLTKEPKMNQTTKIINQAKKEGRKALLEPEAKTIIAEYGVVVNKFSVAKTPQEAAKQAEQIGFPIVLKIVSPDIIHKSDAGGVKVNLKTTAEVEAAYKTIMENAKKYKADAKIVGS